MQQWLECTIFNLEASDRIGDKHEVGVSNRLGCDNGSSLGGACTGCGAANELGLLLCECDPEWYGLCGGYRCFPRHV